MTATRIAARSALVALAATGAMQIASPPSAAAKAPAHRVRAQIVGGRAAPPGRLRAVVRWSRTCSGVLIARRLVLIALHCIDQPPDEVPADAIGTRVVIGDPNGGGATQSRVVGAVSPAPQRYPQPQFSPDLAVLVLTRAAGVAGVSIPKTAFQGALLEAPGSPLLLAGYGATSASADSRLSPTLNEASMQMQSCAAVDPFVPAQIAPYVACAQPAPTPALDGTPPGTACEGDSGAPGFTSLGRRMMLLGVVSGSEGSSACDPQAVVLVASISSAFPWLRTQLHRTLPRPYPPPRGCQARRLRLRAAEHALRHRPGRHAGAKARRRYRSEQHLARFIRRRIFTRC
jgi:secreted trypsin-like serine protease